jgi:hypothetical protein
MLTDNALQLNHPFWNSARNAGFQEVWYLKLNDPAANRALWLRFTLLVSANGFKKVAETWAIYFQRNASKEITKLAVKQTHDLAAFSEDAAGTLRIGPCELGRERTRGTIQSKGKTLSWDLAIGTGHDTSFNLVPESLQRVGLVKNTAMTVGEDLRFTGTTVIDGETIAWKDVAGMQAHLSGPKNGHSWAWGHSNLFVDGGGRPVPFLFEGLSAKARLAGPIHSPQLSTFFFLYESRPYSFNTFWDSVRVKSSHTLTDWRFQADRDDLSFRGSAHAELKDFAGVTYEDTNGSLLYCANSKLSNLEVHVYRRGKLENTFYSHGTAAFEVVSRDKNPYVPMLI